MRVIEPGHIYAVDVLDLVPNSYPHAIVSFVKRVGPGYPGNEGEPHDGTNCQELLRVLINRIKYLDNQEPHRNNQIAIISARTMLLAMEERAAERADRQFIVDISRIEEYPTCPDCGHIRTIAPHVKCPSGGLRG